MALTDKLTAIADAIRAKTGKTGTLTLPQMVTEIGNITGGFENEVVFSALNSSAQGYLNASANYSANDYSTTVATDYASTTQRHDLPDTQTITLPNGAAFVYLCDSVSGKAQRIQAGTTYTVKNLIPNRTYFIIVTDNSGNMLKAYRYKATGALRMIDANAATGLDTFNIRDIGGWQCDGGTLDYGKIFRGSQLNSIYTSTTLSDEEKAVFKGLLGIRVDIDLRNANETAGQDRTIGTDDDFTESALGADVDYLHCPVSPYAAGVNLSNTTQTAYYKTLIKRIITDSALGKPIYIHCAEGADRTGTLIALIEALCGVAQTDVDRDYELTSLARNRTRLRTGSDWKNLITYINSLSGSSFRDKVLYYVLHAGVTIDEVNLLRRSLINGNPADLINPFAQVYTITATTSAHTSISNSATTINEGESYTANISADTDYQANVTVTMGGNDITSTAYNNGVISIASVTGNLVITVTETYTGNLFDASAATLSARINSGGNAVSAASGQLVTDFIPVTNTETIHMLSDKTQSTNAYTGMIAFYNSSKTYLSQAAKDTSVWTNWDSNMLEGYARAANGASTSNPNIAYCRLCIAYTDIGNIEIRKDI